MPPSDTRTPHVAATGAWQRLRLWGWGLREVARLGAPGTLVHLVGGMGDELLCSCIAHELRARAAKGVWVMTSKPELFQHNTDCAAVVPHDRRYLTLARRFGARVVEPRYTVRVAADRDLSPPRHILRIMLAAAGVRGPMHLRPYLHLSAAEKSAAADAAGTIVVQASGQGAAFHNPLKEYPVERLQQVIDALAGRFRILQVGDRRDPALRHVHDLRGQTSLRHTAALFSQARLFLGLEGGLMHLARAVDCPAVIIFGGRLWPEQTGYVCNENLVSRPPCAPCWGWSRCDFGHQCMQSIGVESVLAAVTRALARDRAHLDVEVADITADDVWTPSAAAGEP